MKTAIQEMATDCLQLHLEFWSDQCEGLNRLLTFEDCSSPRTIVGQIITELELRKVNSSNGEGKYYTLFFNEIKSANE